MKSIGEVSILFFVFMSGPAFFIVSFFSVMQQFGIEVLIATNDLLVDAAQLL